MTLHQGWNVTQGQYFSRVVLVDRSARGVMDIVVGKWTRRSKFKSCTRLFVFHIALKLLGKVCILQFSPPVMSS